MRRWQRSSLLVKGRSLRVRLVLYYRNILKAVSQLWDFYLELNYTVPIGVCKRIRSQLCGSTL